MWFNICELGEVLPFGVKDIYCKKSDSMVMMLCTSGTYFLGCFLGWRHVCELNKVVLFEVKCVAQRAEGPTIPL